MSEKKIKTCEFCGKEYEAVRSSQKYCSQQCRKEMQKSLGEMKKIKKTSHIVDTCREARKLGMSYGKYQAMRMMKAGGME